MKRTKTQYSNIIPGHRKSPMPGTPQRIAVQSAPDLNPINVPITTNNGINPQQLTNKRKHNKMKTAKYSTSNRPAMTPQQQITAQYMASLPPEKRAYFEENLRKIEALRAEYLRKGEYRQYIYSFGSEDSFQPFINLIPQLSDKQFWSLLRDVWMHMEEVMPQLQTWLGWFRSKRPGREHLMTDDERAGLAAMPKAIKIWRGCGHGSAARGMSWTTDTERAEFFADYSCSGRRYFLTGQTGTTPTVVEATCRKADVLAFIGERQESEIVVDPKHVTVLRTRPASEKPKVVIDPKAVAQWKAYMEANEVDYMAGIPSVAISVQK